MSGVDKNEPYQGCIPHLRDRGQGNIKKLKQEYLQLTVSYFPFIILARIGSRVVVRGVSKDPYYYSPV